MKKEKQIISQKPIFKTYIQHKKLYRGSTEIFNNVQLPTFTNNTRRI